VLAVVAADGDHLARASDRREQLRIGEGQAVADDPPRIDGGAKRGDPVGSRQHQLGHRRRRIGIEVRGRQPAVAGLDAQARRRPCSDRDEAHALAPVQYTDP
jgi:hypothetical protein